jgi:hypothetical protein
MICQTIVYDEEFNSLTLEAQNLFIRMLAIADDCGVVPGSLNALAALTNPPPRIRKNLGRYLGEISTRGLGGVYDYEGKPFFIFKSDAYRRHQSYIINKRERSEYLKISSEAFDSIAFKSIDTQLPDICPAIGDISIRYKVVSNKLKDRGFQAPKLDEVEQYFLAHGYASDVARRAFDYYTEADPPWTDSRGNQVRSWKSKMQAVWFKPENKTNANQNGKRRNSDATRGGKTSNPSDFTGKRSSLD